MTTYQKPIFRRLFKLLFILTALFILAGCGDDKPIKKASSTSTPQLKSFLTATINGEKYSSPLQIVTFKANNQTHLSTADNKSNTPEYEITLIIQNDKDNDPSKIRYGYIQLEKNDKDNWWQVPNNFEFSETGQTERQLEGTFSFTAKDPRDGSELVVTNGKFRANKKGGY